MKRVPKKANKPKKTAFLRFFIYYMLGFSSGFLLPWYFYLQSIVNQSFVHYHWSVPSSVYARELNFFEGKILSEKELDYELSILGYKLTANPRYIGEYSKSGNLYEIHSKGFQFLDKKEKPSRIKFKLSSAKVTQLNQTMARLEPYLIGQFFNHKLENRQPISIAEIPNTMVMGLQAIEDRNFNQHAGIDIFGIVRALVRNVFAGKIVQGGSTITQQLIKNRFQYQAKSWIRKANEALAALLLEQIYDKGQILESYFNEIYWGQQGARAIHGISQASHYYFSKKPKQLSIAEQALLIGMIKGPSWYHPIKRHNRALKRRNTVLNSWYETSVISKKQWQTAKQTPLKITLNKSFRPQIYKDFLDLVKLQLSQSFSSAQLNQQGLKIFTSVNPYQQYNLLNTLQWHTAKLGQDLQSAAVVSQAQTGMIMALKGSKEKLSYYNRALLSKRQIGSLIKPFVYLAGLKLLPSFSLETMIEDRPIAVKTSSGDVWRPKNWDGKSFGTISAKQALVQSRNQATVQLGLKIGLQNFVDFMQSLGLNINHSNHPSVFLGATELTVLEVTNLFLILSSNGKQQHLMAIKYVLDKDNVFLGKLKRQNDLSLKAQALTQIKSAMHLITTQGTAAKLKNKYGFKNLYGKTGTSNDGKNSWYVGFDQRYLASFWVGKDNNTATKLTGGSGAMLLWANWYEKTHYPNPDIENHNESTSP